MRPRSPRRPSSSVDPNPNQAFRLAARPLDPDRTRRGAGAIAPAKDRGRRGDDWGRRGGGAAGVGARRRAAVPAAERTEADLAAEKVAL
eukprot:909566-Rhodomonas_salina.2